MVTNPISANVKDSFVEKIATLGMVQDRECWIWRWSRNQAGYGRIAENKRTHFAHRLSYEIYVGEIPSGLYVCHECDTPSCVNPNHLWLGTARDNAVDRDKKGRNKRKLSDDVVIDIRQKRNKGVSAKELAIMYGVRQNTISQASTGKRWARVEAEPSIPRKPYEISDSDREDVKSMAEMGVSQIKIAAHYGVSQQFISRVLRGGA